MCVQTAANKGVLLAFIAMAQTLVVITAGIDLSVGMIFVLTNCLASALVVGGVAETTLGVIAVLSTGVICGAINGAIVIWGRLQPIVTTIATGAIYFGIALLLRPFPGGSVNEGLADALTGRRVRGRAGELRRAVARRADRLGAVQPLDGRTGCLRIRLAGAGGIHVGPADPHAENSSPTHLPACLPRSAACSSPSSPIPARRRSRAATPIRCFRSPPWCWAGCRCSADAAAPIGAIFGALAFRTIGDLLFVFDFDPLWQPLFQGVVLLVAVSLGSFALFRVRNKLEWFQ